MNGAKVPKNLQFVYGGTGEVKINGDATAVAARLRAERDGDDQRRRRHLRRAWSARQVKDLGGAKIHYDRQRRVGLHRGQPDDDVVHLEQHGLGHGPGAGRGDAPVLLVVLAAPCGRTSA